MKKNLLYIISLFSLIILFSACSKVSDDDLRSAHNAYEKGAIIIDVRTKEEYKEKHIEKSVNIPLQVLEQYTEHLPLDKEIIVYCRSGSRSGVAAAYLKKHGFIVHDIATQANWERELPLLTKK